MIDLSKKPDTLPRQTVTDLSLDLDLPTGTHCPGKLSTKSDSPYRTRIHERLSGDYPDVENILANWKAEQKCSPNLVTAIRLLDALNKGDLGAAAQIFPGLGLMLQTAQNAAPQKTESPLRSDSESKRSEKRSRDSEGIQALMQMLCNLSHSDLLVNETELRRLARKLSKAGYIPADLERWRTSYWRALDWRGQKGDTPTLAQIQATIGEVKALKPEPATTPDASRYTAHEKPALELVEEVESAPQPRPALTPEITPFKHAYDMWIAELGQLQIQLNRSTYDTWVKGAVLVDIAWPSGGTLTYTCEVPHQYAKDWLDRHLRFNWEKSLSDLNLPRPYGEWDGKTSAPTVHIEILVLGRET